LQPQSRDNAMRTLIMGTRSHIRADAARNLSAGPRHPMFRRDAGGNEHALLEMCRGIVNMATAAK